MKVNELIKILSDFNPNANVKININDVEDDITLYGWSFADSNTSPKEQKLKTSCVSFCVVNSNLKERV